MIYILGEGHGKSQLGIPHEHLEQEEQDRRETLDG
jgi:hypothetical protein